MLSLRSKGEKCSNKTSLNLCIAPCFSVLWSGAFVLLLITTRGRRCSVSRLCAVANTKKGLTVLPEMYCGCYNIATASQETFARMFCVSWGVIFGPISIAVQNKNSLLRSEFICVERDVQSPPGLMLCSVERSHIVKNDISTMWIIKELKVL